MAPPRENVEAALLTLVWTCLCVQAWKNSLFDLFLTSESVVGDWMMRARLQFCPGLLEVMQAEGPPPFSFFTNAPCPLGNFWAVYALTLEKTGFVPKLYIGSGTHGSRGVHARFLQYDNPLTYPMIIPLYVQQALDEGYEITSKALLVYCENPGAGDGPMFRLLFIAIEATLTFYFWSIISREKDYGYGTCRGWPVAQFEYHGLNNHSPFWEAVARDFDLTKAEREEIAKAIRKKNMAYSKAYYEYEKIHRPHVLKAREQRAREKRFQKPLEQRQAHASAKHARLRHGYKISRKFWCDLCKHASMKPYEHERHLKSRKHKIHEERAARNVHLDWTCEPCGYATAKFQELIRHWSAPKHARRQEEELEWQMTQLDNDGSDSDN